MMRNAFAVIATAVAGLLAGCVPAGSDSAGPKATADPLPAVEHVDAAGAAKLLSGDGVVVLDVRTPREFAAGHIKGAKLIDFKGSGFAGKLGELDRNQKYLVHCAVGGRSAQSLDTFRKLGFTRVVHLDGGFNAWAAAGNPVEK